MADGAAENVAAIASQAAVEAGAVVENVTAAAAEAVAGAAIQVEAAQEAAKAIAAAAVHTELGRTVADVQEELDEWESAIESQILALNQLVQTLQSQVTEMARELAELKPKAVLIQQTAAALTAPLISPAPETLTTVTVVEPAALPKPLAPSAATGNGAARKDRWI